jgi:hypothetical protein
MRPSLSCLNRVSRLIRCVDATSVPPEVTMLDMQLGSTTGTRVEGCDPWRPGASRDLTLGNETGITPGKLLCCVPTPPAVMCIGCAPSSPPTHPSSLLLLSSGIFLNCCFCSVCAPLTQSFCFFSFAVFFCSLNYKKHAAETGMAEPKHPVVFYKNPSSVCASGDSIIIPSCATAPEEVDYECELAVVS